MMLDEAPESFSLGLYILDDDGEPQPIADLIAWAMWREPRNMVVLEDWPRRDVRVVTLFLALDFNHLRIGPPVLWETMIFGGPFDRFQWRYRSKLEALQGHARLLALAEVFTTAPRKTRKALQKYGRMGRFFPPATRITRREGRRIRRAMACAGWVGR